MIATLFAEFRKLTSLRSTWILSGIGLLFAGLLAFWAQGYKGGPVYSPDSLQLALLQDIPVISIFSGIVAILLICHEYRYNTIGYTLTATNHRLKVLWAKFVVISGYSIVLTVVGLVLTAGLLALGAKLAGSSLGTQTVELYAVFWRTLLFMITTGALGLILGFLSRNLVVAIVAYFVLPVLEQMIHMLLKVSNNYLPTAAQGQILQSEPGSGVFSPLASAGIFALYLLGGLVVSVVLFMRRDAS